MATENSALAILETPYRSLEGLSAPAQSASLIDPSGVLGDLSRWLTKLADSLECHPEQIVSDAVTTLRRGASSYVPLLLA